MMLLAVHAFMLTSESRAQAQGLSDRQLDRANHVLRLDREAMELFDDLEFDLARRSLQEALAEIRRAGLSQHTVAGRCHFHMALLLLVGFADEDQALQHLRAALAVNPALTVPAHLRRAELDALLARAQAAPEPDKTDGVVAEPEGQPGLVLASSRPAATVVNSRAGPVAAQQEDEENPLAARYGEETADRGPDLSGRWWLGLSLGSGFGYAGGAGLEAYKEYGNAFTPGVTTEGGAHLTPELGYHLSRHLVIAIAGRHQYIVSNNERMARGANAGILKFQLLSDGQGLRLHATAGIGAGEGFRLTVQARANGEVLRDTVRGGPGIGLLGAGALFRLGDQLQGTLDVNAMSGFPSFSLALDVNVGVRVLL